MLALRGWSELQCLVPMIPSKFYAAGNCRPTVKFPARSAFRDSDASSFFAAGIFLRRGLRGSGLKHGGVRKLQHCVENMEFTKYCGSLSQQSLSSWGSRIAGVRECDIAGVLGITRNVDRKTQNHVNLGGQPLSARSKKSVLSAVNHYHIHPHTPTSVNLKYTKSRYNYHILLM